MIKSVIRQSKKKLYLLLFIIVIFSTAGCKNTYEDNYMQEYEENIKRLEEEVLTLGLINADLSEIQEQNNETIKNLESDKAYYLNRVSVLVGQVLELEDEKDVLKRRAEQSENLTTEEYINFENEEQVVNSFFLPYAKQLLEFANIDKGLYYDPAFIEVGTQVGGMEVLEVEGLPWYVGEVKFRGEIVIHCDLVRSSMDGSYYFELEPELNKDFIRPVVTYGNEQPYVLHFFDYEKWSEVFEGLAEGNSLTLLVDNYSYINTRVGSAEFIDVIEILEN